MGDQGIREFDTEMWFRNPNGYVKELAEVGEYLVSWDYGLVKKTRLDPVKTCELYFGIDKPWRAIIVAEWGAAEYVPGDKFGTPSAVYPVFTYGDSQDILEEMLELPWGEDEEMCSNPRDQDADRVPIKGQEHRVVITSLPNMRDARSRGFLRFMAGKQQDYPNCIVHLHGLTAFRPMFAYPFRAVDFEARTTAQGGRVCMPTGNIVPYERSVNTPQWLKLLGYTVGDLAVPRNRTMFNIRSAAWASKYFRASLRFRVGRASPNGSVFPGMGNDEAANQPDDELSVMIRAREAEWRRKNGVPAESEPVDTTSSDKDYKPAEVKSTTSLKSTKYLPGDKVTCDTCSVARTCKVYREGSVCNLSQSDGQKLAKAFGSRDSSQIIDALGHVLGMQSRRLDTAMQNEEDFGETDPNVTTLMNSLFKNGTTLAKLVDPSLNGAGVSVNVGVAAGGQAQVMTGNPNTIMAQIIRVLEDKGIPRNEITSDMVAGVLKEMNRGSSAVASDEPRAIEGVVTKRADG
jgi:hypothetical protein